MRNSEPTYAERTAKDRAHYLSDALSKRTSEVKKLKNAIKRYLKENQLAPSPELAKALGLRKL